jgi:hypothetical protein
MLKDMVASSWPFERTARLTLIVCDGFDFLTTQRGLPTCPLQSTTVRESWPVLIKFGLIDESNRSSISVSSDASQVESFMGVDAT